VIAPEVAIPPDTLGWPGCVPTVVHIPGTAVGSAVGTIMNIVVPYCKNIRPGTDSPTLTPSAQASMVPAVTGMPAGRPVAAAASGVTTPAWSPDHSRRGMARPGASRSHHSGIHAFTCTS
jgi:hypothetical protein